VGLPITPPGTLVAPRPFDVERSHTKSSARPKRLEWPRRPKWLKRPRWWVIALILTPLLIVGAVDFFADDLVQDYILSEVNERLVGYTISVDAVDFHPLNFSLEVERMIIVQDAHPDPPIAFFPHVDFNVQWSTLFLGRFVGDCELASPRFYVNQIQLTEEAKDDVDMDERGWQRALEAMYPLKINRLQVENGSLTYIDDDPDRPLELTEANLVARNIRNVVSRQHIYPSTLHLDSRLFEKGSLTLDGHADFLSEPYPGILADISLEDVPLERLDPVAEDVRLQIAAGAFSAQGQLEWHPARRRLHLTDARLVGPRVDYIYDPQQTEQAIEAAERLQEERPAEVQLDRLVVTGGELGFVNQQSKQDWRVFLTDGHIEIDDYSNDPKGPPSKIRASGRFMDSGDARLSAEFRSNEDGADFDLAVAIEDTDLSSLNDMLRAHAGFDVRGGQFALYAELGVHDGNLEGYIKPLFSDVNIYDPAQDKHKGLLRKVYEGIAEGIADLLENRKRDEVATVAELAGPVGDPKTSNLEVVMRLIKNAFFKSILPGFEHDMDHSADGQARERKQRRKDRDRN